MSTEVGSGPIRRRGGTIIVCGGGGKGRRERGEGRVEGEWVCECVYVCVCGGGGGRLLKSENLTPVFLWKGVTLM